MARTRVAIIGLGMAVAPLHAAPRVSGHEALKVHYLIDAVLQAAVGDAHFPVAARQR